ncbi:MAG: glutamate--tRNA ligase family protein [Hyphomonas sp.]|nr:glutamate--tRNA ligase family protein [Hyphomonas sp.]
MSLQPQPLPPLLFPKPLPNLAELEERYPPRPLPKDAVVTRFAPSPTGSMHIGGVYIAMLAKDLARNSGGTYFVRIEDTDQERKVEGSLQQFQKTFAYFDIEPDDGADSDAWGPYVQSERAEIYLAHVKHLVANGRAYPCFCTKEDLDQKSQLQAEAKIDIGYYGAWATCRHRTLADTQRLIEDGHPYVIRFKAFASHDQVVFEDRIRGRVSAKDNFNDIVILKSSASPLPLPTYHLAHAADDHLMRVSLVLRSDEWISSVPLHLQLFDALGYRRIPYAHISPLMKNDGPSRRKLSKRKDPEASVSYYMEQGYPRQAVAVYLRGIANSRLQDLDYSTSMGTPIRLDGISKSGALLDMKKLDDIASNFVATLTASEILSAVSAWALEHDRALFDLLEQQAAYAERCIDTDRFSGGRVRKDLKRWSDFRSVYGYFFESLFQPATAEERERLEQFPAVDRVDFLQAFLSSYRPSLDNEAWMVDVADIAAGVGFARSNKDYKAEPARYRGSLTDAIQILRIVVTGRSASPSLFEVMNAIGQDVLFARVRSYVLSIPQP